MQSLVQTEFYTHIQVVYIMTYILSNLQLRLTNAFSTTNGSASVTITFSGDHGITASDIILLDNFSTITNSNFGASDFNDKKFMVTSVPSSTTLTITMPSMKLDLVQQHQVVLEYNIIILLVQLYKQKVLVGDLDLGVEKT